jgi:YcaO-like protein with predicted kinase domain
MLDLGGTYRTQTAKETLDRVTPFLKDFGITRVSDVTGLDSIGIHVYQAIRPHSKALSVSQGKGTTQDLAKVSAIMESIELWHAENVRPPDLYGSFSELSKAYSLMKPFPLTGGWMEDLSDLLDFKMYWIRAVDLFTGAPVYLPYTFVHLDFASSVPFEGFLTSSSNGLASGNTRDEALCHALYEAIERDAWEKAQKGAFLQRAVDVSTIKCSYIQEIIDKLHKNNCPLLLIDIESELKVPSYLACVIEGASLRHARKGSAGYGAHFSKEVAISRAITEALQSRLTVISGARDDLDSNLYEANKKEKSVYNALNKFIQNSKSLIQFSPSQEIPSTFSDCIKLILQRLEKEGFKQALYVDHTREKFEIPVVQVVIPQLKYLMH